MEPKSKSFFDGSFLNDTAHELFNAFLCFKRSDWGNISPAMREGIKHSEMTVLMCIHMEADAEEGLKISEISQRLRVTSPTITQLINSMTARGLVKRHNDLQDKRVTRIRVTDAGQRILEESRLHFLGKIMGLMEYLGEEESKQLSVLLLKATDYFEATKNKEL